MVKTVSPGGALLRVLGLPSEMQCPGPSEVGDMQISFLYVTVNTFQLRFLGLQSLCSSPCFGRGSTSFFIFGAIFIQSVSEAT